MVYGGGGIIPDVFVPLNTSKEEDQVNFVLASGYLGNFVFEYLDKNRNRFFAYNEAQFIKEVTIDDELMEAFIAYAANRRIVLNFDKYAVQTKKFIKATIAEQLYSKRAYHQIIDDDDAVILQLLELREDEEGDS